MAVDKLLSALSKEISPASRILKDRNTPAFQTSMERWSNLNKKTPYGIVQPATEQDILLVVRKALDFSVPFVPVSGGHSTWSSIDKNGVVIDLSTYTGVAVNTTQDTATVRGGTLMKELQTALHPYKRFTAVGNGSTIEAVSAAVQQIAENKDHVNAGHVMIVQAPPDLKQQVLFVAPQVFCSAAEAARLFQPLKDIGPIQEALVPSTFETHSDHLDWVGVKGEFKRFSQIGLKGWDTDNFKLLARLHSELVADCADAARSGYSVEWHSPCKSPRALNTSFGLEDVDYWLNVLSWYSDAANHDFVGEMDEKAQAAMRVGTEPHRFVAYTNTSRDGPIEFRYKGVERISRLQGLKRHYDPEGIFTREVL
ncbi:uncharacterized protein JN550_003073 [Neoarthrinium moseri]|uniref:uncharacterized protein n=1 Tax=Neoarthrinium moseri TaxID=1658444 RepID=UPI001FDBB407|nr:uncharacterized protein JN550_003073 [Neoarthrinium moseri]KAI1873804.1 hypothetical protein JN550_003073 [Neoarthrinium moseri]